MAVGLGLAIDSQGVATSSTPIPDQHNVSGKPPSAQVESNLTAKALLDANVPLDTRSDRVRHVIQGAFDGHCIVIFSGGAAKGTEAVLEENRQTAAGGGFGTIMGRNSFQRPHDEAVQLLHQVQDIHLTTWPANS